jgi:hypothetical protein
MPNEWMNVLMMEATSYFKYLHDSTRLHNKTFSTSVTLAHIGTKRMLLKIFLTLDFICQKFLHLQNQEYILIWLTWSYWYTSFTPNATCFSFYTKAIIMLNRYKSAKIKETHITSLQSNVLVRSHILQQFICMYHYFCLGLQL